MKLLFIEVRYVIINIFEKIVVYDLRFFEIINFDKFMKIDIYKYL